MSRSSRTRRVDASRHRRVIARLVAEGHASFIGNNLDRFRGLDLETAESIIAAGLASRVAISPKSFRPADRSAIARRLIALGLADEVVRHVDQARHAYGQDAALALVDCGRTSQLLERIGEFVITDWPQLIDRIFAVGAAAHLAKRAAVVVDVDRLALARRLVEAGAAAEVIASFQAFPGLDIDWLYRHLTKQHPSFEESGSLCGSHRVRFSDLRGLSAEIATEIVRRGNARVVAQRLKSFVPLPLELAEALVRAGCADEVAQHPTNFAATCEDLATLLLDNGAAESLAIAINDDDGVGPWRGLSNRVARRLIGVGYVAAVAYGIRCFVGLDGTVAKRLLADSESAYLVAANPEAFPRLSRRVLARRIVAAGQVEALVENIEKYPGVADQFVADALIAVGGERLLADRLSAFTGLSAAIACHLARRGCGAAAACRNYRSFRQLDLKTVVVLRSRGRDRSRPWSDGVSAIVGTADERRFLREFFEG